MFNLSRVVKDAVCSGNNPTVVVIKFPYSNGFYIFSGIWCMLILADNCNFQFKQPDCSTVVVLKFPCSNKFYLFQGYDAHWF